jgi:gluconolactonase
MHFARTTLLSAAAFLVCSAGFAAGFTEGQPEQVRSGHKFTEGPLYMPEGHLLFSDIPAHRIYKEYGTVFREESGYSNGLTLDREGRLIAAEHKRRVSRTEKDGTIVTLAEAYEGKKLNSPNDVIVRSDGTIFFTDPPYGGNKVELDFNGVYKIAPDGALSLLVKDFIKPNGLALSPDEKTLYVADTEGSHLRAFDVAEDGSLSNGRVLCEVPGPDGIKVDTQGNIWATAGDGVRVISPTGELLDTVVFPEKPANCCFGGVDGKTLYVTARTGVYKIRTTVEGIRPEPGK